MDHQAEMIKLMNSSRANRLIKFNVSQLRLDEVRAELQEKRLSRRGSGEVLRDRLIRALLREEQPGNRAIPWYVDDKEVRGSDQRTTEREVQLRPRAEWVQRGRPKKKKNSSERSASESDPGCAVEDVVVAAEVHPQPLVRTIDNCEDDVGPAEELVPGVGVSNPFDCLPVHLQPCLLYTSPSPRDRTRSRMPSSA